MPWLQKRLLGCLAFSQRRCFQEEIGISVLMQRSVGGMAILLPAAPVQTHELARVGEPFPEMGAIAPLFLDEGGSAGVRLKGWSLLKTRDGFMQLSEEP